MPRYWLMKSEPDDFSIHDLERVGVEPWTGVRNYQARNFMRDAMRPGDGVLFYHSNTKTPGIAGVAEVSGQPYPDPTQFERASKYHDPASTRDAPRWWLVDVRFVRRLREVIPLARIRAESEALGELELLRKGSRLSVSPVTAAQWKHLLSLEASTR